MYCPRPITRPPTLGAVLAALIICAACGDGTGPQPFFAQMRAKALWANEKPASYSMTISRSCECLPAAAVVVTVVGGGVESRRYAGTGDDVPASYADLFPSVAGLFDMIDDLRRQKVASLDVQYDPVYGHPTRIVIDRWRDSVDDEVLYTIRDFQPR
jgi:hypothetical protein